jgi:hypothetical protein
MSGDTLFPEATLNRVQHLWREAFAPHHMNGDDYILTNLALASTVLPLVQSHPDIGNGANFVLSKLFSKIASRIQLIRTSENAHRKFWVPLATLPSPTLLSQRMLQPLLTDYLMPDEAESSVVSKVSSDDGEGPPSIVNVPVVPEVVVAPVPEVVVPPVPEVVVAPVPEVVVSVPEVDTEGPPSVVNVPVVPAPLATEDLIATIKAQLASLNDTPTPPTPTPPPQTHNPPKPLTPVHGGV